MTSLNLAQARRILDAAFESAARRNVISAVVVVTDAGGALVAAQRSDAAAPAGVQIATAKARTALGFRRSTLSMEGFRSSSVVTASLTGILGPFMPMGGGVVIVDSTGDIAGAAAFSGAAAEVDHEIIAEAAQAVGLVILD